MYTIYAHINNLNEVTPLRVIRPSPQSHTLSNKNPSTRHANPPSRTAQTVSVAHCCLVELEGKNLLLKTSSTLAQDLKELN